MQKHTSKKKTARYLSLIFLALFVLAALSFGTYYGINLLSATIKTQVAYTPFSSSNNPYAPLATNTPYEPINISKNFKVNITAPKLIGASYALFSAELLSEKNGYDDFGFYVIDATKSSLPNGFVVSATYTCGKLYAKTNNLNPKTLYYLMSYTVKDDVRIYAEQIVEFTTPPRILQLSQVDDILTQSYPQDTSGFNYDARLAYTTDACLYLLGFDLGESDTFSAEKKMALLMLDYSFNADQDHCNWSNINGQYTPATLAMLKDMISVTPMIKKENTLTPFTVAPYALTPYAHYTEKGATIDCDQYILDQLKNNDAALDEYTNTYPYIIDSAEFQQKYAQLINQELDAKSEEMQALQNLYGWDTLKAPLPTILAAIAAKNKVLFADAQSDWLANVFDAKAQTYLLPNNGPYLHDAPVLTPVAVAFAYMQHDYNSKTGNQLNINIEQPSVQKEWRTYSNGYGKTDVLSFSALWHLDQQQTMDVPRFDFATHLVSVDIVPTDDKILSSDVYAYLYNNAYKFGFYAQLNNPWRWLYLGKTINQETFNLAPLKQPTEK